MRLFLLQSQWEKELNIPLTGLSLIQTMTKCLIAGQTQKALKLKNDYKVSEKRFVKVHLNDIDGYGCNSNIGQILDNGMNWKSLQR